MLKQKTKLTALACVLSAASVSATAQQAKLLPLSPAQLKEIRAKLDPKLLPQGATRLELEPKQTFRLVSKNETQITLVPVHFTVVTKSAVPDMTKEISDCGVYLLPAKDNGSFIWIIGQDEELAGLVQCTDTKAVGIQSYPDDKPALILIINAYTVHESLSQPYVLLWNKDANNYQIDDGWTQSLSQHSEPLTIQSIKRLLAPNS